VNIAIIPARGGSKRIPQKNIKNFCGKPMIAWSIEAAKKSGLFSRIIVSTDNAEISAVAIQYGAECPFVRPIELSDDHSTVGDVMAHATHLTISENPEISAICCIFATAPHIDTNDLATGLRLLNSGSWSYAFSATTFEYPIFRAFEKQASGELKMVFPNHYLSRSQDLPEAFHDAGQFYWGRPVAWINKNRVLDKWATPVFIPRWRVQDIDTEEDWKRVEELVRYRIHMRGA
jgi:pseudaminic acid cytidylyltransferase